MCIALLTTAHPSYALIVLNNRDEYILRPTSKPHWWSKGHQQILSSRDELRSEGGTWLGITRTGKFAILTNYKEKIYAGAKSRGVIVNAWLTGSNDESTQDFVHRMLDGEGVKTVGGFSLVCGKLRKRKRDIEELEPLVIISNRSGTPDDVPRIAEQRGKVYGLSNTFYDNPEEWPKVKMGKQKIMDVVTEGAKSGLGEDELVEKLFAVLDMDTLPPQGDMDFQEYLWTLRESIFIPEIGKPELGDPKPPADDVAAANPDTLTNGTDGTNGHSELSSEALAYGMSGTYGTQRQTIVLVDWDGNVTYRERSLFDNKGLPLERGLGDTKIEFQIEGWNADCNGTVTQPHAML